MKYAVIWQCSGSADRIVSRHSTLELAQRACASKQKAFMRRWQGNVRPLARFDVRRLVDGELAYLEAHEV